MISSISVSRFASRALSTYSSPSLRELVNHPGSSGILLSRSSGYTALKVNVSLSGVATINLNRPSKQNALNVPMWAELIDAFDSASLDQTVRVCILGGEGDHFCSGMDLTVFSEMQKIASEQSCQGRKREAILKSIEFFQRGVSAPELCIKPVLAAMTGNVIGGAIDLVTATDMRYVTNNAKLSVKEVDLAIVADVGTMQRLPHLVGDSRARELAYTGRDFSGSEAVKYGLALEGFASKSEMEERVNQVAEGIAKKSPLTVRGIKKVALFTRDHSVEDSLNQVAQHNAAMLFSDDLDAAFAGMMTKKRPTFKGD